jgi:hypothetical protein
LYQVCHPHVDPQSKGSFPTYILGCKIEQIFCKH